MVAAYAASNRHQREAAEIFREMPERNVVSWNTMIASLCSGGAIASLEDPPRFFDQMMPEKSVIAATAVIEALGHIVQIARAKSVFDAFPSRDRDLVCSNAMLAAYARNGRLADARATLDAMAVKNIVSWSTILLGFAHDGDPRDASKIFREMQRRNEILWLGLVAAFAQRGLLHWTQRLFDRMPSHNAGIAIHSKNGELAKAERIFQRMPLRNRTAWAAPISAPAISTALGISSAEFHSKNWISSSRSSRPTSAWAK